MRQELYDKLKEALSGIADGYVKHIDLWNRNVEFIEEDTPWERPAVFIEFNPIKWVDIVPGVEYRAEATVRLHIITDWANESDEDAVIDQFVLPELIHEALAGLEGDTFKDLRLSESITNHNHEEIIESIEVYSFVAIKSLSN